MRRVVTETDSQTHGARARISSMTLSLPTPEGPDRTVSLASPEPRAAGGVADADWRSGRVASSEVTAVVLHDGAAARPSLEVQHSLGAGGELRQQSLALLLAKAAQAATLGDLQ